MPESLSPLTIVLALAGVLFAGFVKGAAASGFPLIATPVISLILGPRPAVLAVSIPTLFINTVQSIGAPGHWGEVRRIVPVLVGELIGVPVGVWLLVNLDQRLLSVMIGLAVLGFVVYSCRFPEAALPPGRVATAVGPLVGF